MPLLTFKIDDETLKAFGRRFTAAKQRQVRQALGDISRAWRIELDRQQQTRGDGEWPYWSTFHTKKYRSYYERRKAEEKNPPPHVKYFTVLKRTGRMMEGYLGGVKQDYVSKVTIPWPKGYESKKSLTTRAKVHQGLLEQPEGSLGPRPFNVNKLKKIAVDIISKAVKSDPKKGPYRGYSG